MIICCMSFQVDSLKGTWEFQGGIYNGKKEGAPTEYTLQRKYKADTFDAWLIEKGEKNLKYQSGNYQLQNDSCLETETFNVQSARLTGITVHYHYHINQDTLTLQGVLPTGMKVEEYWKKVK